MLTKKQILKAYKDHPNKTDAELADMFGVCRSSFYKAKKTHGTYRGKGYLKKGSVHETEVIIETINKLRREKIMVIVHKIREIPGCEKISSSQVRRIADKHGIEIREPISKAAYKTSRVYDNKSKFILVPEELSLHNEIMSDDRLLAGHRKWTKNQLDEKIRQRVM